VFPVSRNHLSVLYLLVVTSVLVLSPGSARAAQITLNATPPGTITSGGSVVLAGSAMEDSITPVPDASTITLLLQKAAEGGGYVPSVTTPTAGGDFSFTAAPTENTDYKAAYGPDESAPVRVNVRPTVSIVAPTRAVNALFRGERVAAD